MPGQNINLHVCGHFFSKSRMWQYHGMLCYILWIQKCICDACRLSLHNSTASHCINTLSTVGAAAKSTIDNAGQ